MWLPLQAAGLCKRRLYCHTPMFETVCSAAWGCIMKWVSGRSLGEGRMCRQEVRIRGCPVSRLEAEPVAAFPLCAEATCRSCM